MLLKDGLKDLHTVCQITNTRIVPNFVVTTPSTKMHTSNLYTAIELWSSSVPDFQYLPKLPFQRLYLHKIRNDLSTGNPH